MTRRRSRLQIVVDVLRIIDGGCRKPTRIMYKSNLSGRPLTRILDRLVNDGLVKIEEIKHGRYMHSRYTITSRGKRVLEAYRDLGALLNWRFHVELD